MKVICAGLLKTGTKTMAEALRIVGYNVHDIFEQYLLDRELWNRVRRDAADVDDYRRALGDVDAVTEMPGCGMWEEIHKAFPEAKVILMVRSSEDEWVESVKHHSKEQQNINPLIRLGVPRCIQNLMMGPFYRDYTDFVEYFMPVCIGCKSINEPVEETLIRIKYREHNTYVKATCPPDKLLVFNVKDGWEPLCKFLGVPVPNVPFPIVNVKAEIIGKVYNGEYNDLGIAKVMKRQMFTRLSVLAIIIVVTFFSILQIYVFNA